MEEYAYFFFDTFDKKKSMISHASKVSQIFWFLSLSYNLQSFIGNLIAGMSTPILLHLWFLILILPPIHKKCRHRLMHAALAKSCFPWWNMVVFGPQLFSSGQILLTYLWIECELESNFLHALGISHSFFYQMNNTLLAYLIFIKRKMFYILDTIWV